MHIGIGLPSTIPGAPAPLVLDWARRADAGPFSSLGVLDRLVYTNYEPLVTLAAAAGVTQRIRLMTTVLIAPLRNAGILAKQAATIDALSNGRLTLGLGVGGREDDFLAAPVAMKGRGRRFEQQLDAMTRIWAGRPAGEGVGPIGPRPARAGGPEVLIGGNSPDALRRVGRWGDGFISGGGGVSERTVAAYKLAEEAWKAAGRPGKPRFVAAFYYGLGPDVAERAAGYIRDYYAFLGPMAEYIAKSIVSSPEAAQQTFQSCVEAGVDEVIAWPCIAELDQVDRLAEAVERFSS
ncbi:MAG TPA: LLM class flavin-dependent oxidoreductase [Ktedonobacterales bacterium]|nr:LLM class flavin-dependent oxidoreductase [Ktedonobacterales bacterium]